MIKHIWFDFSDTLVSINKEARNKLRYETYAKVAGKQVNHDLIQEYNSLYEKYKHSNSAIFESLGKPPSFWSQLVNRVDPKIFYFLADKNIPKILQEIKEVVPVSIFSNIDLQKILPALGLDLKLFTHILSASAIGAPKPALDGYYKMVKLSRTEPNEILYIGDDLQKDVIPAKSLNIKTGIVFEKIEEADYSFKDFNDILRFVKENKR